MNTKGLIQHYNALVIANESGSENLYKFSRLLGEYFVKNHSYIWTEQTDEDGLSKTGIYSKDLDRFEIPLFFTWNYAEYKDVKILEGILEEWTLPKKEIEYDSPF